MKNDKKFKALHEKHAGFAYVKASRILKSPQDIEDALQEAWIRVHKNLDKIDIDAEARARAYIGRIVENECFRLFKKNISGKSDMESPIDGLYKAEDVSASVEAAIVAEENAEELEAALSALSETEKRIFLMKHSDDMRNADIAKTLGLDAEYVGMKLTRIAKKLAKAKGLKQWAQKK
jgi:RNA polymerase sigma-70 factor (ECF subfamily)